jgi:hypothetical protein
MLDLPTQEQKLKAARQEVRTLQVLQMRPDQSAEMLELLRNVERLAREEVSLRREAIEQAKRQQRRGRRTKEAAVALLRMIFSYRNSPQYCALSVASHSASATRACGLWIFERSSGFDYLPLPR